MISSDVFAKFDADKISTIYFDLDASCNEAQAEEMSIALGGPIVDRFDPITVMDYWQDFGIYEGHLCAGSLAIPVVETM